ncbi:hypothetical protein ATCV1_z099R [Acanthocystis turfacea chlorella virus 1]|uniref:Uncharacterized protein z099R n=1 Tax=Chlorovirus heliozoae TaxID=322019 RepID=A7K859_9PHYC|nr:hypothetical protein ATCV1_z099R [Acanthocystis turfacea chlorella virus 1]ABT16233.1 hypothetical protein ATCV1_z099R [Acanthocystis turfacea chlorella virus 1]
MLNLHNGGEIFTRRLYDAKPSGRLTPIVYTWAPRCCLRSMNFFTNADVIVVKKLWFTPSCVFYDPIVSICSYKQGTNCQEVDKMAPYGPPGMSVRTHALRKSKQSHEHI